MNKKDNDTNARAIDSLLNYEQVKANVNEEMETNLYRDKILTYQKTQERFKSHPRFRFTSGQLPVTSG